MSAQSMPIKLTDSAKGIASDPVSLVAGWADRWLLVLLLLSYVAATFWPAAGQAIRTAQLVSFPVPLLLLAVLLLVAGMSIDGRQISAACRWRWLVLAGQIGLWGVPLAAVLLLGRVPAAFPPGLLLGLGLVALMPVAASSVAWSQLTRGNIAISLGLLATSTLLCPLVIPLVTRLGFSADGFGEPSYADGSQFIATANSSVTQLMVLIIPAVLLGAAIRWWVGGHRLAMIRPYTKLLSTAVLVLLNYASAALALPQVLVNPNWAALAVVIVTTATICSAGFYAGRLLARGWRVDRSTGHAIVFGLGMKNTGMALVLSAVWFPTQPLVTITIIVYTLMQHVLAANYHRRVLSA